MVRSVICSVVVSSLLISSCGFTPLTPLTFGRRSAVTSLHSNAYGLTETVLIDPKWPDDWPYDEEDFERMDEEDDAIFYKTFRMVHHLDEAARTALTEYYSRNLLNGQDILDLCSSWVSYLPYGWAGRNVVGLGMNEEELSQNVQLSDYVIKDLNKEPVLPFKDNAFDVVTCVVSVEYLIKPREVFQEIGRVLRPGGTCMIVISDRCFPTRKAFRIWLQTNDVEHVLFAGSFFHYAGMFDPPRCDDISPLPGLSDPLYVIRATKKQNTTETTETE